MEFFVIFGVIFSFCDPRIKAAYGRDVLPIYMAIIIALVIYAVFYALKAIGLSTMAKNEEICLVRICTVCQHLADGQAGRGGACR